MSGFTYYCVSSAWHSTWHIRLECSNKYLLKGWIYWVLATLWIEHTECQMSLSEIQISSSPSESKYLPWFSKAHSFSVDTDPSRLSSGFPSSFLCLFPWWNQWAPVFPNYLWSPKHSAPSYQCTFAYAVLCLDCPFPFIIWDLTQRSSLKFSLKHQYTK